MEKLPEHKILQLHSDTLQYVRKDLGLDKPGQMDAAIDLLDDWVKKQAHFNKKDFSRTYLERTIILDKGSVERAKVQMERLLTMRTSLPHFFDKMDPRNDFVESHAYFVGALLPKLTREHYRVYAWKVLKEGFTSRSLKLFYVYSTWVLEFLKQHDYCSGVVIILDYRDINIKYLITQANLLDMHQFIMLLTEGYQMRVKSLHILTKSNTIDILVKIIKQFFSKKIGERIRTHVTVDPLHEFVPNDLLPKEFGGELKSLVEMNDDWIDVFSTKENINYMNEMKKATVNEDLRTEGTKTNEDILGIPGSFKTLSVD